MKFPITQNQFREWRKKNPNSGRRESFYSCPVAQCLKTLLKTRLVEVFGSHVNLHYRQIDAPKWVFDFVERYDAGAKI